MNIGAGWKRKTKDGKDFLSCNIQSPFLPGGELSFAIFPATEKRSEKSPDVNLVWNPQKRDDYPAGSPQVANQPFNDSDLPF